MGRLCDRPRPQQWVVAYIGAHAAVFPSLSGCTGGLCSLPGWPCRACDLRGRGLHGGTFDCFGMGSDVPAHTGLLSSAGGNGVCNRSGSKRAGGKLHPDHDPAGFLVPVGHVYAAGADGQAGAGYGSIYTAVWHYQSCQGAANRVGQYVQLVVGGKHRGLFNSLYRPSRTVVLPQGAHRKVDHAYYVEGGDPAFARAFRITAVGAAIPDLHVDLSPNWGGLRLRALLDYLVADSFHGCLCANLGPVGFGASVGECGPRSANNHSADMPTGRSGGLHFWRSAHGRLLFSLSSSNNYLPTT